MARLELLGHATEDLALDIDDYGLAQGLEARGVEDTRLLRLATRHTARSATRAIIRSALHVCIAARAI